MQTGIGIFVNKLTRGNNFSLFDGPTLTELVAKYPINSITRVDIPSCNGPVVYRRIRARHQSAMLGLQLTFGKSFNWVYKKCIFNGMESYN